MQTSICSKQGHRPYQEDSASIQYTALAGRAGGLLAMATLGDGVGGEAGGAAASNIVMQVVPQRVLEGLRDSQDEMSHEVLAAAIRQSTVETNLEIHKEIQRQAGYERAASTLANCTVFNGIAIFTTVGDSPAWLINGHDQSVEIVTRLHKWVGDAVLRGEVAAEDAKTHPYRNVLTTAMGSHSAIRIEQTARNLEPGDVVLVMSDGVSESISHAQATQIVQQAIRTNTFSTVAESLVQAALDAGSRDNCTAIALLIEPSDVPADRPVCAASLGIGRETVLHERLTHKEHLR